MDSLGQATSTVIGIGLACGVGCLIALLQSIYRRGYQRAIEDSLKPIKPRRFFETMQKVHARDA